MAKKAERTSAFIGNEWQGWMIFKRKGTQIGLVQSSFSLSEDNAKAMCRTRCRPDEEVRRVRVVIED